MGGLRGELGAVTARKKEDKEDNSERSDDNFHHAVAVKRPESTSLFSFTL